MRKKLLGEFLGTFILMFVGTGAIIVNYQSKSITPLGISLLFGLIIAALIYTFRHISGAHFNPVVTISLFLLKDMSLIDTIKYIVAQIIGAIAASSTLLVLFGNVDKLGATQTTVSWQKTFIIEFILTFILILIVLSSAVHKKAIKSLSPIAIGGTIAAEAMFCGHITGASMNPARSIGPALMSGYYDNLWIYIIATIFGGVAATFIYKYLADETK